MPVALQHSPPSLRITIVGTSGRPSHGSVQRGHFFPRRRPGVVLLPPAQRLPSVDAERTSRAPRTLFLCHYPFLVVLRSPPLGGGEVPVLGARALKSPVVHLNVDGSSSDDSSTRTTYGGLQGPALDGVLLNELGENEVDTPAE